MIDLDAIVPALRAALGADVVRETEGWQARGLGVVDWVGQMNHHTGIPHVGTVSDRTAAAMIRGRSDLRGPLCNGHGGLDANGRPLLFLVAGKRANHAGDGVPSVLQDVMRDVAPRDDAGPLRLKDSKGAHGNRSLFGWEWMWHPDLGPFPPDLVELVATANAALARLAGWTANRSIDHREWTHRKTDMSHRNIRTDIARLLGEPASVPEGDDDVFTDDDLKKIAVVVQKEVERQLAPVKSSLDTIYGRRKTGGGDADPTHHSVGDVNDGLAALTAYVKTHLPDPIDLDALADAVAERVLAKLPEPPKPRTR